MTPQDCQRIYHLIEESPDFVAGMAHDAEKTLGAHGFAPERADLAALAALPWSSDRDTMLAAVGAGPMGRIGVLSGASVKPTWLGAAKVYFSSSFRLQLKEERQGDLVENVGVLHQTLKNVAGGQLKYNSVVVSRNLKISGETVEYVVVAAWEDTVGAALNDITAAVGFGDHTIPPYADFFAGFNGFPNSLPLPPTGPGAPPRSVSRVFAHSPYDSQAVNVGQKRYIRRDRWTVASATSPMPFDESRQVILGQIFALPPARKLALGYLGGMARRVVEAATPPHNVGKVFELTTVFENDTKGRKAFASEPEVMPLKDNTSGYTVIRDPEEEFILVGHFS